MQVRNLMTQNPAMCTPDTKLQDVARMMVEHDCGAIPIVESKDSRKPVGLITDRDITVRLVAKGQNPIEKRAADAMTDTIRTIRPDASIEACADMMEEHQVRRLVVVEDGACVGIVAQADLALEGSDETTGEVVEQISEPAGMA